MNGYRSYTNTPTDREESPLGVGLLRLNRLNPYKDALTIGPVQRIVLDDKKDELQNMLLSKKQELESELMKLQRGKRRKASVENEEGLFPVLLDEVKTVYFMPQ